jgi:predicted anti-sigma-YlaC factor YlaD
MTTNPPQLTCMELVELITNYLEGSLPNPEHVRFETHLEGCSGCRNYLEQMQKTITMTGKLTEERIAPAALDEMLKIFRNWKKQGH